MNWWLLFISVSLLAVVGNNALVPQECRERYRSGPLDFDCYLALLFLHGIWAVALVQDVVAPSRFPDWVRIAGATPFLVGHGLVIWARQENPFFTPSIILPDYIVKSGPYKWLKHPGYIGLSVAAFGAFLVLGQWWATLPLIAYQSVLGYRAYIEGRILSTYFPNYQ